MSKAIDDIVEALNKNWYTYKTRSGTVFYVKVLEPKLISWADNPHSWVSFRALRYNLETKKWLLLSFTNLHTFSKWDKVSNDSNVVEELNKLFKVKKVRDLLNGD